MELHKQIKLDKIKYNMSLQDDYLIYFAKSMDFVMEHYKEDFDRIANTKFENVSPEHFLREMAWCICVSGFNAKIVSRFFPKLLEILNPLYSEIAKIDTPFWYSKPEHWALNEPLLQVFGNKRKINAILANTILVGRALRDDRWETYRNNQLNTPQKLEKLDMIGPVISMQLARNCGLLAFVKPDLHLVRMSKHWGFDNPIKLCKAIQQKYDLPLGLIDLVLFYAASSFGSKQ